jgi:carbonic anhydrase/acetyltransferase-like protein (isoleucine patch superfamily)
MLLEHKGIKPRIGKNVFIAPTATVIGNVEIKDGASIWYGTVVRGDRASITVGTNTNIQDNSTVHSDPGKSVTIGDNVTVGHNAVIHACTIEDDCIIGINSVVLTDALVKTGSVVAAGSVIKQGQVVGPYHLMVGIPATLKKELPKTSVEKHRDTANSYHKLAGEHLAIKKAGESPGFF